jgi:N-glycosylase/DNA lyase
MDFIDQVLSLRMSETSLEVLEKREEFIRIGKSGPEDLFSELCFCILAANTSAEMGLRVQKVIGSRRFLSLPQEELSSLLKRVKYRFYNVRSKFIVNARWIAPELPELVASSDREGAREYLVSNVDGIGYKEASHFLRNVGIFDFAILDKHVQAMLLPGLNEKIGSLSTKRYLELEGVFKKISERFELEPGIMDLYMWKIATGRIIK